MLDAHCGAGGGHGLLCGTYADIARGHRAATYGHADATGNSHFAYGYCGSAFEQRYCRSGRDPGSAGNSRWTN